MAEEGEEAVPPAAVVGEDAGEAEAEAGEQQDFGLPAELVAVLPSDPFAQLDVARKITSIALSSRLGRLEAEAARLRAQLAERDAEAEDLRERVEQLDAALAVATGRLRRVEEEKVRNSPAAGVVATFSCPGSALRPPLPSIPWNGQRLSLAGGPAATLLSSFADACLPLVVASSCVSCHAAILGKRMLLAI
jgi:hypothetical protein